ncbi:MAG: alpha/beta hydrolase [Actinomycetota bacterium]|nr:alpha/beta hydrolase [Actinomycetota bacterium]
MNRFTSSGGELAYRDEGSGPAVLLLHGFPLTSYLWRRLIPALAARHRVLAPDLLGLGGSEHPAGVPLDIRAQATYVGELLDHLELDRVAVIGHSTGGGIAQLLAHRRPDVQALVLIDSVAFDAWPTEAVAEVQVLPPERETFETVELVVRSALSIGTREGEIAEDDVDAYLQPWRSGDVAGLFRWARALDGIGLRDLERPMATWDLPTLILWGEDDPFHPVGIAERLNAAIPSSALGLVPGCGHYPPEEAAETIDPIISEYLRANYLRIPHGHAPPGPVFVPLGETYPFGLVDEDDDEGEPVVGEDQEVGPNA